MSKLIKCVIATTVHARFRMAAGSEDDDRIMYNKQKFLEVKFLNLGSGRCL